MFDLIHQTKQGDVLKSLLDLVAKVLELLELSSRFVFAHPPLIESGVAWVCLKFIFLSLLSSENEFYRNWNLHELVLSATRTFRNIVMVSSLIEDGNQDLVAADFERDAVTVMLGTVNLNNVFIA